MTSLVASSWIKTSQCFPSCYCRTRLIETCYPTLAPASLFATHINAVGMVRWAYQPCHSPNAVLPFSWNNLILEFLPLYRLNLALNLNSCCLRLLYESENIHPFCPLILFPWEGHIFIPWNLWHGHVTCICMYNESRNLSAGVCSRSAETWVFPGITPQEDNQLSCMQTVCTCCFQCRHGAPMPLA